MYYPSPANAIYLGNALRRVFDGAGALAEYIQVEPHSGCLSNDSGLTGLQGPNTFLGLQEEEQLPLGFGQLSR